MAKIIDESISCIYKKCFENVSQTKKSDFSDLYNHWLGYLDSNQGMTVSETVVLPLDYIPIASKKYKRGERICQQGIFIYRRFLQSLSSNSGTPVR